MDSTTQTTNGDIKLNSDLFDLAEKLRIELQKKDQELEDKNEEITELLANLDLAMTRANRADELENGMASTQQINHVLQMSLWKSFPFPDLSYYIQTRIGSQNTEYRYLYASSADDDYRKEFKFTKNSDGTFLIYSIAKKEYMQAKTNSRIGYIHNKSDAEKFVLFFHQQNQHAGLLVDISTLAGNFLCIDNENYVAANSRTQPVDKFLIIPVGVE